MQREYGSDFPFIDFSNESKELPIQEIYPDSNLFFSGRTALFNLINLGIKSYRWKKIFFPEYYCHDVDDFIKGMPIDICYYNDGPGNNSMIDLKSFDEDTNAFIHVNYFGFNTSSRIDLKNAFIIEDHTHDLLSDWALNSNAQFCFASLRKSFPVAAGGIIWSPKKIDLPFSDEENNLSSTVAYMKLSAMLLKKNYLEYRNINKDDFRNLYLKSESLFEKQDTNAMLPSIIIESIKKTPVQELRNSKIKNYTCLSETIKTKNIIWKQTLDENQCPFGFVLWFDDEEKRNSMKNHLIKNCIYPAVLWPHQKENKAKDFSSKNLLVHCDIRYNSDDMKFIADTVNNYKYAG